MLGGWGGFNKRRRGLFWKDPRPIIRSPHTPCTPYSIHKREYMLSLLAQLFGGQGMLTGFMVAADCLRVHCTTPKPEIRDLNPRP